jgi:hypothetical protein
MCSMHSDLPLNPGVTFRLDSHDDVSARVEVPVATGQSATTTRVSVLSGRHLDR